MTVEQSRKYKFTGITSLNIDDKIPEGNRYKIMFFVTDYTDNYGKPPTVKEIGQEMHHSSTSVTAWYITDLIKSEWIIKDSHKARTIRVNPAKTILHFKKI